MHVRSLQQSGFTLIEMIVALAVFSVVITISVGALLMLIAANQQLQNEQSVMTNLSFALDSMTREIRTGSHYYCGSAGGVNTPVDGIKIFDDGGTGNRLSTMGFETLDCEYGRNGDVHGLAFIEGGQSITGGSSNNRITYYFDEDELKIFRLVSGGSPESIVSSGINILDAQFYVTGTDQQSASSDTVQPTVTIYIQAEDSESNEVYDIQTMVTQRTIDL